jgi:protoporphyrinogen oxidase
MPLTELVRQMDPPPPADVLEAARRLRFRALVFVGLIVKQEKVIKDNWIYIHGLDIQAGRLSNFSSWSPSMSMDPTRTNLGMEYFVNEGDEFWLKPDRDIVDLAKRELHAMGFADAHDVEDAFVIKQPKAYPTYDDDYRENMAVIRRFMADFKNIQTIGRNGMHRYNNMDHSMMTGIGAAQNLQGSHIDLWTINEDPAYHESTP